LSCTFFNFGEVTRPAHQHFLGRKRAREQGKRTSQAELEIKEDLEVFNPKAAFSSQPP
jgi:hypothetical protein